MAETTYNPGPLQRPSATVQFDGHRVEFMLPSTDDHISRQLLDSGRFYESEMLETLALALSPGDLVVDVGANIGNHALFFAVVCECKVEAFEAYPPTAELLRANIDMNRQGDRVQVHSVAVGAGEGAAKIIAYDPHNVGGTTLQADAGGDLPMVALDSVMLQGPVRLLKVDAEGMDLAVLQGAQGLLRRDRPWVVCEAGSREIYKETRAWLQSQGYAAAGVYNATDTYLFLPAEGNHEFRALVERGLAEIMLLQRGQRRLDGRINQATRYSERLKREALDWLDARLEAVMEAPTRQSSVDAGSEAIANSWHRIAELRAREATDLRTQMAAEREDAELRIADLERTRQVDFHRAERLVVELREAKRSLSESRSLVQALNTKLLQSEENGHQRLSELQTTQRQLRDKARRLSDAIAALGNAKVSSESLRMRFVESEKKLAEHQRHLAESQKKLEESQRHLEEVMASTSFQGMRLIAEALRSPLKLPSLLWTLPRLGWRQRVARRLKRSS